MDMDQLEKLIELMKSNDLVEVEIETDDSKIRLKKAGDPPMTVTAIPAAPPPAAPLVPAGAAAAPSGVEGDSVTFNSPMVGTFYTAPAPGAEVFVKVGDKVSPNTVLCIIEAMKVMNEITADIEAEVLEVLVGNGEAVEYNQPLFTLKPR